MNKYRDRWNRSGHRVKQRVIDNMFHFEKKFVRLKRKKKERERRYTHQAFCPATPRPWPHRRRDRCRRDSDRWLIPNNERPVKIQRWKGQLGVRNLRRTRSSRPRKLIPPAVYRMPRSPTRTMPLSNKAIRIPR